MSTLRHFWASMDPALKHPLLHGSVGTFHLLAAAQTAFGESQRLGMTAVALGRDLLLAAWEADPLNGGLAAQVLDVQQQAPWLTQPVADLLQQVQTGWNKPQEMRYYQRLAERMDPDKLTAFLLQQQTKDPGNIYWAQQAQSVAELFGSWEFLDTFLQQDTSTPEPLKTYLQGCSQMLQNQPDQARTLLEQAAEIFSPEATPAGYWLAPLERLFYLACLQQDTPAMGQVFRSLVAHRPWNTNLLLAAHDQFCRASTAPGVNPVTSPDHSTGVLLYSWNKEEELHATLESLYSDTAPGWDKLLVLDNGSTDSTPQIIRGWQDKFADRMRTITLPVNVGAAAARNWLMQQEDVARLDYVTYLDDDVVLGTGWLQQLGQGVARDPEAAVWGCRILDDFAPHIIQSADLHLNVASTDPAVLEQEFDTTRHKAEPFNVSNLHSQVVDMGMFTYTRPCISVTGCCHMFKTSTLQTHGGFNLSLSPSQYDDLEHDLRLAQQGHHCCYNGHLSIRHKKRTGKGVRMSAAQFGNGLANKYKLHHMFDAATILEMRAGELELLEQDLLSKTERLQQWFEDNA